MDMHFADNLIRGWVDIEASSQEILKINQGWIAVAQTSGATIIFLYSKTENFVSAGDKHTCREVMRKKKSYLVSK